MERRMTSTEALVQTTLLLREHGLEAKGWTVRFDNAKRRAGQCDYLNREISLSRPLMAHRSYDDTVQTITHEIAHALVGHRHHHDRVWQRQHKALGGNGKPCFADDGGLAEKDAPWVGSCEHGQQWHRYRAPQRLEGWVCRCGGTREKGSPVVWSRNG